jgi:hypothetical protein
MSQSGFVLEKVGEYREVVGLHAEAAPLQTLGTNTPRQRAKPFEDEAPRAATCQFP